MPGELDIPPPPFDLYDDEGDYVLSPRGIRNGVIGGILAWGCLITCAILLARVFSGW